MDYYFGVAPTKRETKYLATFSEVVKRYWIENRKEKRDVSKTFINKVLFDLIENEPSLNFITRGWFKYGAVVNYTPNAKPDKEIYTKFKDKLIALCEDYNCNKEMYDWQFKQYKKFNNKLYDAMLNLIINLNSDAPNEKVIRAALSNFYINLIDSRRYDRINSLIEDYISKSEQILVSSQDAKADSKKICSFFNDVWSCFANFNYAMTVRGDNSQEIKKRALSNYILEYVNRKKEIDDYLNEEINPSKRVFIEISTPLQKEIIAGIQSFK